MLSTYTHIVKEFIEFNKFPVLKKRDQLGFSFNFEARFATFLAVYTISLSETGKCEDNEQLKACLERI